MYSQSTQIINADTILRDIRGLSSGTLATLTNHQDYDTLDKIHTRFIQFSMGVFSSNPKEFENWQTAWSRFITCYPEYIKDGLNV
jgi:hypothetical protein